MDPKAVIESVFRQEHGRIIATLIRVARSFDRAEEAMQDAFASALASWPETGIPQNPAAWITAAAYRKLIDRGRHEKTVRDKQEPLRYYLENFSKPDAADLEDAYMHLPDDRLRLIFTCCHPALNRDAQIALTLRTLGGLTTSEIAKAFLVPEATLAQRLVRAKRKIEDAHIPYETPGPQDLPERVGSVQAVVYLIFNEGYTAASGDQLVRSDLCNEAIRLGRILCELMPAQAEMAGLLALMLLHDSRRNARMRGGQLITLEEQDRSLWDRAEIEEGLATLERVLHLESPGPYCLQAEIAAEHARPTSAGETDWTRIASLYARFFQVAQTPVVALNHAVAIAMSGDLAGGLSRIDNVAESGSLDGYYLLPAARADILRRMGKHAEAAEAYRQALRLAVNRVEQDFLRKRLGELELV
jgi:RNA polymerase sigma-70 factor (ECF subfamily)